MSAPTDARATTDRPRPTVFGRDLARQKPTIVRAEGIRMWDSAGNEYIDGSSGAVAVISVGHGRREVVEAMAEQAGRVAYVHGGLLRHEAGEALARALTRLAPGNLNRAIFVSGGSEANESAIKLARQCHVLRGKPDKTVVLSRRRSYHGMTLGALSISGYPARRTPFAPLLLWEPAVAECNCYRCPLGLEYPNCELACADDLERVIVEVGAGNVAAFIAEPIVAAAGPGLTPPPGYFERVRAICDAHDILFIADEVVTGMGRTGMTFGIEKVAPYWLGGDSNRAPYTPKGFDTKAWTNGTHTLTATVTDAKGRTGSASLTINVQN